MEPLRGVATNKFLGTPHRGRTCNLRYRKPTLYPVELTGHKIVVRPARFERATTWFEAKYSNPLSYGRITLIISHA